MANFTPYNDIEKTSGMRWLRERDRLSIGEFKEAISNASTENEVITLCGKVLSAARNGEKIDRHERALAYVRNFVRNNVSKGDYITAIGLFNALPNRSKDNYCACIAYVDDMRKAGELKEAHVTNGYGYYKVYQVV